MMDSRLHGLLVHDSAIIGQGFQCRTYQWQEGKVHKRKRNGSSVHYILAEIHSVVIG